MRVSSVEQFREFRAGLRRRDEKARQRAIDSWFRFIFPESRWDLEAALVSTGWPSSRRSLLGWLRR